MKAESQDLRSENKRATSNFMNLTDDQKKQVAEWLEQGASISDVQSHLKETFGLAITYMDTRFLIDDLRLQIIDPIQEEDPTEKTEEAVANTESIPEANIPGNGQVSVTIDQITRPSALISGRAVFSDGQKAEWYLDNTGRLGLNPDTPGYRPSQSDVLAFQAELEKAARSQGL